jgi:GTPase SAR1 family protein
MLIGIGGSGKTSLIRQLFHDPQANPEEATEHYEIYSRMSRSGTVISPPENGGQAVHLFISDYKGQDLGSLVRAFIRQQKQSYSPMAYNYVTALILIVDLIAPPTHKGEIVPPREHPDPNRVAAQIDQWTDSALDAVFGMLTNTLKYVCLFINKIDLITSHTPKDRNRIRKMYAEVEARLAKRSTGATFEVFIGSATDGTQLPILEQRLLECSVPDAALFDGRE